MITFRLERHGVLRSVAPSPSPAARRVHLPGRARSQRAGCSRPPQLSPGILSSVPPASFAEDYMSQWSLWVLNNGLPPIPSAVEVGESVPVAYWAGPAVGAVLHRTWAWTDDHDDDVVSDNIQCFRRGPDGWVEAGAQGGSSGGTDGRLTRLHTEPTVAYITGEFTAEQDGWVCCCIDGCVGIGVEQVEVHDSGGVVRRTLDSPLGLFVAASGDRVGAVVVLADHEGNEVLRTSFGLGG